MNMLKSESESSIRSEANELSQIIGKSTAFRCDHGGCGAQAFAASFKDDMMLLWCGHHKRRHEYALTLDQWEIFDNTHLINEKPSVSATVDTAKTT